MDEVNVGSADNELIAWVNGEARGIAKELYFPPKNHWVYNLMIYGNNAEGDTVEFSFYDGASQEEIFFNEELIFLPDMVVANAEEPFELRELSAGIELLNSQINESLKVYPNPVSEIATIIINHTSLDMQLEVVDIMGKIIVSWDIQNIDNNFQIFLDTRNLKTGIYLLRHNLVPEKSVKFIIAH